MTTSVALDNVDFPFAVNCRFSKTIMGLPKKCDYCQKMIVGTGFTCQNCSFRCHKRCVMIEQGDQVSLRMQRCPLTPPGEDSLISRLLNEMNANGIDHSSSSTRREDSNGNTPREGIVAINYESCCPSSSATSPSLLSQPSSPPATIPSRGYRRKSLLSTHLITPSSSNTDRRLSTISTNTKTSDDHRHHHRRFIDRLLKLFAWTNTNTEKLEDTSRRSNSDTIDNDRRMSMNKAKPLLHMKSEPACHQALTRLTYHGSPTRSIRQRVSSNVVHKLKPFPAKEERRKSAYGAVHYPPNTGHDERRMKDTTSIPNHNLSLPDTNPSPISPLLHRIRLRTAQQENKTGHKFLRNHESDPIKIVERRSAALLRGYEAGYRLGIRGSTKMDDQDIDEKQRLANTWPLMGYHIDYGEHWEPISDNSNDATSIDKKDDTRNDQTRLCDLGEWTISYSDLIFSERVHECRNITTYKGRWHGDVMIHTYDISGNEEESLMKCFLDEVRTLTKIRHENVALFMGASVEAPLVAVVTSIRKGCNLYETVHIENRRLAQTAKLNIARQVAQGMAYLHAKGIVLKTLTSKSIYLECKVKISMVDDGAPLKRHDRTDKGCIRRGHLTYLAPELMQTIRVSPPALIIEGLFTKEADVYAFGTILYEMFVGDFPLSHLSPHSVIWQIGNGKCQSVDNLQGNASMKGLIECCWSDDLVYRPSFTELLKELQHTATLHIKHSSSVPEKMNKLGIRSSEY